MRNDLPTAPVIIAHRGPTAQRRPLVALLLLILCGLCMPLSVHASSVVAYPLPSCYISATSWHITAKGTDGISVPLTCRAYEPENNGTLTNGCYYCRCAINGSTTFAVDCGQTITTCSISPKAYGITATLSNGTTTNSVLNFTIPSSQYLEINIAGKAAVLCLLADPFETNAPPSSGAGIFNVVTQYGADNTGVHSDTTAINNAITAANANTGGGTVYFPPGIYLTSPVTLKSNVAIYLAGGSVLRADPSFAWANGGNYVIKASGISNIEIFGRGEIDCRGSDISNNPSVNGGPQVSPIKTETINGLQIYGITATDSTGFTIHPGNGSTNVTIANVKVINRYDWLWNDGMDITDVTTCNVTHCFIRTDDDACTVKTGWFGQSQPSSGITINDMVVDTNSGCGFCVGAETDNTISGITAENFQVIECNRGLALLHRNGVGTWSNMTFQSFTIEDIGNGLDTWNSTNTPADRLTGYRCAIEMEIVDAKGNGVGPISSPILCKDITFLKHGPTASYLWGDTSPNIISGVTFTNLVIEGVHITSWTTPVGGKQAIYNMDGTGTVTFN
jgi:hypothetical protein